MRVGNGMGRRGHGYERVGAKKQNKQEYKEAHCIEKRRTNGEVESGSIWF